MTRRTNYAEYLADIAASPTGELLHADWAHVRDSSDIPKGKTMFDHQQDWADPKYDWEICIMNDHMRHRKYARCKNTGTVRSGTICEHYNKTPLEVRKA